MLQSVTKSYSLDFQEAIMLPPIFRRIAFVRATSQWEHLEWLVSEPWSHYVMGQLGMMTLLNPRNWQTYGCLMMFAGLEDIFVHARSCTCFFNPKDSWSLVWNTQSGETVPIVSTSLMHLKPTISGISPGKSKSQWRATGFMSISG